MKLIAELRRLFSPYEFAVAGELFLSLTVAVMLLLAAAGVGRIGFILIGIFMLLFVACEELSRCPQCRRRPSGYYFVKRSGEQIPIISRLWPERVCSGCGTRLDGI